MLSAVHFVVVSAVFEELAMTGHNLLQCPPECTLKMSILPTELLERVLFRLGTADSDAALEAAVCRFLAPVLLKITSPAEPVRCKVMEILTHLNKRLKSRPLVQLPVDALLDQYQQTDSAFLHNFSIIYITMGFPRLAVERQTELAAKLLTCLEAKQEAHQDK